MGELNQDGESAQGGMYNLSPERIDAAANCRRPIIVGPHKGANDNRNMTFFISRVCIWEDGELTEVDSMLSSYLLQVPPHKTLQVQNSKGTWVPCPPIDGTFVVAMGQGLEAITGGVVASTTHRVLSPAAGEGPRYSIPFFQGVSYDATFESMEVPEEVRKLKKEVLGTDVEMTFRKDMFSKLGDATLTNRVKVCFTSPSSSSSPIIRTANGRVHSPTPTSARSTTPTS
jgi:hypothetical protein